MSPRTAADDSSLELIGEIFEKKDAGFSTVAFEGDLSGMLADPRFQEIVAIVNLAVQVHGNDAKAWFSRPEPELGYVLPATLLRDPANGRRLVKQSLINHLRGSYALDSDDQVLPAIAPTIQPLPAESIAHAPRPRLASKKSPRKRSR